MDVCLQARKLMSIMLLTIRDRNMLLKYIRLVYLYSRIEIGMLQENLGSGMVIAKAILGK